jgi:hypothetical protein
MYQLVETPEVLNLGQMRSTGSSVEAKTQNCRYVFLTPSIATQNAILEVACENVSQKKKRA